MPWHATATPGCAASTNPSVSYAHLLPQTTTKGDGCTVGLDIHRDFCAIAISENGRVRYVCRQSRELT